MEPVRFNDKLHNLVDNLVDGQASKEQSTGELSSAAVTPPRDERSLTICALKLNYLGSSLLQSLKIQAKWPLRMALRNHKSRSVR
jgi:hypothetical protein